MPKLSSLLSHVAVAALLVGSLSISTPLHAQSMGSSAPMGGQPPMNQPMSDQHADEDSNASPSTGETMSGKSHGMQKVEQRIKTLHDKLKITPQEENDWQAVAQTMRNNEAEITQLIMERHQNAAGMTAVDDLQSYQKITQAHADGLTKMISSFQTLYNDMSDSQKKNADEVFGRFEGHAHGKHHK